MARYIAVNGELVENWDVYYTRDSEMKEFRIMSASDGGLILDADRAYMSRWNIQGLINALQRHLEETEDSHE